MQPGEAGKIPVKINSKRGGPVAKSINVYTNVEGVDATIRLKIKGTVWEAVQVSPRSASFGRIAAAAVDGKKGTKVLSVVNNVDGEMKLTDAVSSNPAFAVEIQETVQGKQAKVTVKIVKPLKQGSNRGKITIKTGVKEMPTLSISVSAHLAPELEVRPKQFTVFPDRPTTRPYSVLITNNGKTPIKITDLAVSNPEFKVALSEKKPGTLFGITLELPKDYKLTGNERVTFKTNHPSFPTMTVPIMERTARGRRGGNLQGATSRSPRTLAPTGAKAVERAPDRKKGQVTSPRGSTISREPSAKKETARNTADVGASKESRVAEPTKPSPTRKTEGKKKGNNGGKVDKLSPADKAKAGNNTKPAA